MDVKQLLGVNLKRFRAASGLTQGQLAERVESTVQTIFSLESGAQWPRADLMGKLCDVLGCAPWQLLATEGQGGTIPPELVDRAADLARACGLKVSR